MFIYIPRHLSNIDIVSEMTSILQEYVKTYGTTESRSFDHYYYFYTIDPVKNFIRMCLAQKCVNEDPSLDYDTAKIDDGVLWYLIKLFYSVKGTPKVLDLMASELGLEFVGPYTYTDSRISYEISEISSFNLDSFVTAQEKFLGALMYYYDLTSFIDSATLNIRESLESDISLKTWTYTKYETTNI